MIFATAIQWSQKSRNRAGSDLGKIPCAEASVLPCEPALVNDLSLAAPMTPNSDSTCYLQSFQKWDFPCLGIPLLRVS